MNLAARTLLLSLLLAGAGFGPVLAQTATNADSAPTSPEVDACKSTALVAMKARSPSVREVILDPETLVQSKADTKIEDTPIRTVIMAEAYLEREKVGKPQRFLCLVGDKGKVLLTYFTER
jgi:hypothetical protein